MRLLAELKRRNMIRMAGLYLVAAWLVTQVTGTVLPMFEAPAWLPRSVVILLAVGFIPALVFSWVFEMTPDGIKRDADVAPGQSIAPRTARRMDRMMLVVMALALAVFAADRFLWRGTMGSEPLSDATGTQGPAASTSERDSGPLSNPGGLVAVLPFRNLSVRTEDAYFAEGMHDDLLTQLSKVSGLKVISRTSMMRYAGSGKSVPEIADELRAAVVLEGSVQRAGDQVRINVQLIDGSSDVHLWAQRYDRVLNTENIFAIQADIAQAIADAMAVVLSPAQADALATGSTKNLEAYESFLRGKLASTLDGLSASRLQSAIAAFDRAIELDPAFADAWARKTRAQLIGYWFNLGPESKSQRDAARKSLARAQQLAPNAIETLLAEAYFHYWGSLDYARADAALKRVLEQVPDNVETLLLRAYIARRDGRFDEALAAMQRSQEIDPANIEVLNALAETQGKLGKAAQGLQTLARARALGTESQDTDVYLHEAMGDIENAWAAIERPDPTFGSLPFRAALLSRDPARIAQSLSPALWPLDQREPADFPEAYPMAQAEGLLVTGQREQAQALLGQIQSRMQARPDAYPAGWTHNGYYVPCDLPGMRGDLEGVRAAERSYEASARDAWAARDIRLSLAIAFARAGDPDRALHHLEAITTAFDPASYLRFSIQPGLDAVRTHPRYLALKTAYESRAKENAK